MTLRCQVLRMCSSTCRTSACCVLTTKQDGDDYGGVDHDRWAWLLRALLVRGVVTRLKHR